MCLAFGVDRGREPLGLALDPESEGVAHTKPKTERPAQRTVVAVVEDHQPLVLVVARTYRVELEMDAEIGTERDTARIQRHRVPRARCRPRRRVTGVCT